jgi:hypothetical protein
MCSGRLPGPLLLLNAGRIEDIARSIEERKPVFCHREMVAIVLPENSGNPLNRECDKPWQEPDAMITS